MIDTTAADRVLTLARRSGADYAEIYAERWKRRTLRVIDGKVQEANSGIEFGVGVRLFFGTDVVYAYGNDRDERSLIEMVSTLIALRGGAVDASGAGGLDFRRAEAAGLHAPQRSFDSEAKRFRLARLRDADAAARIGPEVRQVEGAFLEWEQDVELYNSDSVWATDRRVRSRLVCSVIASDASGTQTGSSSPGLSMGLELLDRHPPETVAREAAETALTNLRAGPAPAGTMPVVIGNAFGGVIFHEALGHLLEATWIAKPGASVLEGKLGEKIASESVTYIDDGTTPHGWGSSEYDDEGAPSERTTLIERGVLVSYMVDRLGSLKTGLRATGSGRRQNYTFAPTSRMRNTFIAPGNTPRDDLFAGIDIGLYAKKMGGGQVSPGSGEYNFAVTEGYMIRNGRIEEPVRGAMLVGKGPDTIARIEAVSDDLSTAPGMCGSISGSIPVEVGQPHLLVNEIVVGGRA
jgi:TldD protein